MYHELNDWKLLRIVSLLFTYLILDRHGISWYTIFIHMTDDPLARISVAPLANVPIIHVCYIFSSRSKGKVQGFHSTIGVLVSKRTHCHTGCLEFAFFFFSFSQFSSICFESILHSYPTADHALCAFSSCWRCFQKLFFFFFGASCGCEVSGKNQTKLNRKLDKWQMMILDPSLFQTSGLVPHLFRSKSLSREGGLWSICLFFMWVPAGSPGNVCVMLRFIVPQKMSVQCFWHQKKQPMNCHFAPKNATKIFHAFNWKFADVQRKASSSLNGWLQRGWVKHGISFFTRKWQSGAGDAENIWKYM